MKKFVLTLALVLMVSVSLAFAASTPWWYGQEIQEIKYNQVKHISSTTIDDIIYPYRYVPFTDEVFAEIEEKLNAVKGVDFFTADAEKIEETGGLRIVIEFYELPVVNSITFTGNSKIKTNDLKEAVTVFAVGDFVDSSKKALFDSAKAQVITKYNAKGFESVPVEVVITEDQEKGNLDVEFVISEGIQTRIVSISYSGNENVEDSVLKKEISSKVKGLFNSGYLDYTKLRADAEAISLYYQKNGYIDVIVGEPIVQEVPTTNEKYKEVTVEFPISEGLKWYYGGMEVSGNKIFSDEQISEVMTLQEGSVLDLQRVQNEYTSVADLYYNDGYISNGMNVYEQRDDTNMTVKYYMDIVEGPQASIEDILITGLTKTKDYVMRRELALHPGDVFSKAKLVTSAQNLYNTGLLSDLNYNLLYGQEENSVIIDFNLEEGSQKDIQFGATFGGTLNGFPVSGFLQLTDRNLGGRGQQFDINTTLSPDSQSISLSFGDNWFKDKRWANSFTFGFSHTIYDGELQLGVGSPAYYNGRNDLAYHFDDPENATYPLGYTNPYMWYMSDYEYPSPRDLMMYRLLTFSLGYSTGYTFIYDVGRLTYSGGLSVSLNKAIYDKSLYNPYEKLIFQYGQKWQFSNKLSLSVQWDGRDYITNTTKGYVLSAGITYAGGALGGLSNYIKLSGSAAGYLKLFSFTNDEGKKKNIMLCASSSASFMLPQLYNYENQGLRFWDPKFGATRFEMLYIDGMTIGRGFNTITDQSFLWDNMLEISYQLVENVIQAEAFVSATGINAKLSDIKNGINWYYAAGAGIKLKISGFPLGLYMVKNATYRYQAVDDTERTFNLIGGNYFHNDNRENSGMSLVLAISLSLI